MGWSRQSNISPCHGDRYEPTDALSRYLCHLARGVCADCWSSNGLEWPSNDHAAHVAGSQRGHNIHTALVERRVASSY